MMLLMLFVMIPVFFVLFPMAFIFRPGVIMTTLCFKA